MIRGGRVEYRQAMMVGDFPGAPCLSIGDLFIRYLESSRRGVPKITFIGLAVAHYPRFACLVSRYNEFARLSTTSR